MRREERHHLKENPLAVWISDVTASLSDKGGIVVTGLVLAALVVLAAGGYFAWQGQQQEAAGDLLGRAMASLDAQVVPPPADDDVEVTADEAQAGAFTQPPGTYPSLAAKYEAALPELLEAADAYPTLAAGVTARYHAATVLVALGDVDEAVVQYQQVIDAVSPDDLYGALSVLGLSEAYVAAERYQDAIQILEGETATPESVVPVDAVLMQLGRAHRLSGQSEDALSAFTRVVQEFPTSVYYAEAQRQVDVLQSGSAPASGD